ncbi:MAG: hypothetical protein ACRCV7_02980 [Culicoidibacterales bacterium]
MIELHTQDFEKITLKKGVNIFTFAKSSQSEKFLKLIEEAFYKRKKSNKLFLVQEEREKYPKDYYYVATNVGKHGQETALHDVLLEKLIYDFYHDESQMKSYYDFQCQYQMFLNQLELKTPDYNILFHSENFQEKTFLKQLEFDVMKNHVETDASDRLKIYCDTKLNMWEKDKEIITIIPFPEAELGVFELAQFSKYLMNLPGYVIVVTNVMKYFIENNARYNIFNCKANRINIEDMFIEYQMFDPDITIMDIIHIVEYYITGNMKLVGKRYAEMVKSSGINEADMV